MPSTAAKNFQTGSVAGKGMAACEQHDKQHTQEHDKQNEATTAAAMMEPASKQDQQGQQPWAGTC